MLFQPQETILKREGKGREREGGREEEGRERKGEGRESEGDRKCVCIFTYYYQMERFLIH